ncbi:TIGR00366 family protein [Bacillus sp. SS-TM]
MLIPKPNSQCAIQYIRAFSDSTKSASGILLQFPFYAGIMGMMIGANSEGLFVESEKARIY